MNLESIRIVENIKVKCKTSVSNIKVDGAHKTELLNFIIQGTVKCRVLNENCMRVFRFAAVLIR